jgi:hypothetical protein
MKDIFKSLTLVFIWIVIAFCVFNIGRIYGSGRVRGLWIPRELAETHEQALKAAINYTEGNWLCINIYTDDYKQMEAVIMHELGHEMFAQYCDKSRDNFERCIGLTSQK